MRVLQKYQKPNTLLSKKEPTILEPRVFVTYQHKFLCNKKEQDLYKPEWDMTKSKLEEQSSRVRSLVLKYSQEAHILNVMGISLSEVHHFKR